MSRSAVTIPCGAVQLEAEIQRGMGTEVAVICHPHPLYGGNMDNNVVTALAEVCASLGWTTLRFNFRGVGASTGAYGDGDGETQDLMAVVGYARQEVGNRVHLIGYSFGAWVVLNGIRKGLEAATVTLASPPVDFMDFSGLTPPARPTLIVVGDSDPFCAVPSLNSWLIRSSDSPVQPQVVIVPGCDHFYWGFESRLAREVAAFVQNRPDPGEAGRSNGPAR